MTTFHIIHVIVGIWLAIAPTLDFFASPMNLFWNNVIVGAVVAAYNIYFLAVRQNVDVK